MIPCPRCAQVSPQLLLHLAGKQPLQEGAEGFSRSAPRFLMQTAP